MRDLDFHLSRPRNGILIGSAVVAERTGVRNAQFTPTARHDKIVLFVSRQAV